MVFTVHDVNNTPRFAEDAFTNLPGALLLQPDEDNADHSRTQLLVRSGRKKLPETF